MTKNSLMLGFCVGTILFSAIVLAQQRTTIAISSEGVKSRYVQQQVIDVDDVPGHQVRVQESHREFPTEKQLVVEGERVVESWVRGFSNYTGGIGPAWGT